VDLLCEPGYTHTKLHDMELTEISEEQKYTARCDMLPAERVIKD
jgi:hypothetical protein